MGESHTTQSPVLQPFNQYDGVYRFRGSEESHPISLPFLNGSEGSSFPGFVLPYDMVDSDSVMGMKPVDASVVIGYEVDEFTHTWLTYHFVL